MKDLQARDGRLRFKLELAFLIDFGICRLILSSNLWDVLSSHCGEEFAELVAIIVRSQIIRLVVLRNSL